MKLPGSCTSGPQPVGDWGADGAPGSRAPASARPLGSRPFSRLASAALRFPRAASPRTPPAFTRILLSYCECPDHRGPWTPAPVTVAMAAPVFRAAPVPPAGFSALCPPGDRHTGLVCSLSLLDSTPTHKFDFSSFFFCFLFALGNYFSDQTFVFFLCFVFLCSVEGRVLIIKI